MRWIIGIVVLLVVVSTCARNAGRSQDKIIDDIQRYQSASTPPNLSSVPSLNATSGSITVAELARAHAADWRGAAREDRVAVAVHWTEVLDQRAGLDLTSEARALFAAQLKACVDDAAEERRTRNETVATLGAYCMLQLSEFYRSL